MRKIATFALALGLGGLAGFAGAQTAEQDLVPAAPVDPAEEEAPEVAPGEAGAGPAAAAAARRRDPFRPFNLDTRPKQLEPPKTPLEQYEIGSLTLVAIIWNVSDPKAMVEDAAGLGFTVGIGTPIGRNGGIIRKIEPDQVIVEEEFVDFYGEKKKKEVVLRLEPEGEKRP